MDSDRLHRLHDLTGRVAIVTGGTRVSVCRSQRVWVAAGAKVAVASRKAEACERVEGRLRSMGGEAIGVPTDMGEIDSINAPGTALSSSSVALTS